MKGLRILVISSDSYVENMTCCVSAAVMEGNLKLLELVLFFVNHRNYAQDIRTI